MVADAATVGFEHPHGILLALVKVINTQSFKVKVGKRLMRTVKVGSHKTVEKAVVTVGELLFEGIGCPSEPIDKALPNFLNLGICHLYSMSVPYFNCLSLSRNLVRHLLALINVGNGIAQGMLEEIDAVIAAELSLYGIKTNNLRKNSFLKVFFLSLPYLLLSNHIFMVVHTGK